MLRQLDQPFRCRRANVRRSRKFPIPRDASGGLSLTWRPYLRIVIDVPDRIKFPATISKASSNVADGPRRASGVVVEVPAKSSRSTLEVPLEYPRSTFEVPPAGLAGYLGNVPSTPILLVVKIAADATTPTRIRLPEKPNSTHLDGTTIHGGNP